MTIDYNKIEEGLRVRSEDKINPPIPILQRGYYRIKKADGYRDYPKYLGTRGNFSFIQAPPKHKKSFLVSLLAGVALGGAHALAPDLKSNIVNTKILHFDTEQSKYDAKKAFRRAFKISRLESSENYLTYALRPLDYKTRIGFIDHKIKELKEDLSLVIIDGVIDLVSDPNNLVESELIVQKLLEWTYNYNIHILTVIHTTGYSDKPTGHLGTFLERKTELQYHLSKNPKDSNFIDVKFKSTRGFSPDEFTFYVNEYGLPQITDLGEVVIDDFIGK